VNRTDVDPKKKVKEVNNHAFKQLINYINERTSRKSCQNFHETSRKRSKRKFLKEKILMKDETIIKLYEITKGLAKIVSPVINNVGGPSDFIRLSKAFQTFLDNLICGIVFC